MGVRPAIEVVMIIDSTGAFRTRTHIPRAVFVALLLAACGEPNEPDVGDGTWVGAWAAAPGDSGPTYSDQSLRLVLTPLRGGESARVRLSNRFGSGPVTFRSAFLGRQASGPALVDGSNVPLRFDGADEVTVPAGAEVVSDPVAFSFAAFEQLAVSLFVPAPGGATQHFAARQTSYVGAGDVAADEAGNPFEMTMTSRPFVVGVDVVAPEGHGVVVAIGDSITDGDQRDAMFAEVSVDADARYPDFLARRVSESMAGTSVINLGISGNRVLRPGIFPFAGPSLVSRIESDVLHRSDVTDVILLQGINDLALDPQPSAAEVLAGLEAAVALLKEASGPNGPPNVLVGTLTPAGGAAGSFGPLYADADGRRREVNEAIRAGALGDGFVDFDRAVQDPEDPSRLAADYDGGDGLHLSPAGYERMAEEVDLSLLQGAAVGSR